MDSLSQFALGAALGVAVMGRRTAAWKAALVGGLAGTLPDLDALIDFGDPVSNMSFHRGDSHALFWLALLTPPLGALVAALLREPLLRRRWMLAVGAALLTHPLLDLMTVYGTQLLRPFSGEPYGIGSLFIIDPLYTLPLLIGVGAAVSGAGHRRLRWNAWGLGLSTAYIAWSLLAQAWVRSQVEQQLRDQGIQATQLLVTAAPLTTLLWQVVVITPDDHYLEGQRALLDPPGPMPLTRHARGSELMPQWQGNWHVQRAAWFSRGFWALRADGDGVVISDLRMGLTPNPVFAFRVEARQSQRDTHLPVAVGSRGDVNGALRWLGQRVQGKPMPPPGLATPPIEPP